MKIEVYSKEVWLTNWQAGAYSAVFGEMPDRFSQDDIDMSVVGFTDDDQPIGYITVKMLNKKTALWCHGGTFPDFRTKGLGNDAVQSTAKFLKNTGVEIIMFFTKQKNIPMQRMALANGFFPSGFTTDEGGIYFEYQLNTEDL